MIVFEERFRPFPVDIRISSYVYRFCKDNGINHFINHFIIGCEIDYIKQTGYPLTGFVFINTPQGVEILIDNDVIDLSIKKLSFFSFCYEYSFRINTYGT